MQLAMPQLYAEVALKSFSMIFGHYLTPIGYEYTPALPNFFYSHSYNFNFEPGTFTGTLATYRISDQLQLIAGFQRGAQTWTPRYMDNDRVGRRGRRPLDQPQQAGVDAIRHVVQPAGPGR